MLSSRRWSSRRWSSRRDCRWSYSRHSLRKGLGVCYVDLRDVVQFLCLHFEGSVWATAWGVVRGVSEAVVRGHSVLVPECVEEGCMLNWGYTLLGQGDTLLSLNPMGVCRPLGSGQLGQALLPLQEPWVGQALVL